MKTDTNTSTSSTFFWHDYETFGLSPAKDRPAQFAGVRTDMDLNEIGEPLMLYCQLPTDYLPSPESTLITGITPQLCNERGVPEPQFAQTIVRELAAPDTIGVGYNTIRFDDEVTRFMLWRNLFPPYKREFENGCSRWDLIDVVRCAYALRPEGIVWPTDAETGKTSLRLEHLTAANGLAHESAHDALSDVRATIAFARLLRNTQPRLFEFALKLRQKKAVQDEIGWPFDLKKSPKPFLPVSGMFGAERRYLAVVYPLAPHPTNKNELIVWDLAADPALLLGLSVAQIRERLFTSAAELGERGLTRLPIKTIHINKSPVVIAQLKTLNDTQSAACGVDWEAVEQHESNAVRHFAALQKIDWAAVFEREYDDAGRSAEEMLYGGGFVPDSDYRAAEQAMDAQRQPRDMQPNGKQPNFKDARLVELWWLYRARHFPHTLSADEQARWHDWRAQRLIGDGQMDVWLAQLNELGQQYSDQPDQLALLQTVYEYGQSLADGLE